MILKTDIKKWKTEQEILTNMLQENELLQELFGDRITSEMANLGAKNCRYAFRKNTLILKIIFL